MKNNKSSLKTFLAGKNPYIPIPCQAGKLKASTELFDAVTTIDEAFLNGASISSWWHQGVLFFVDVLDDGTAITYSATP